MQNLYKKILIILSLPIILEDYFKNNTGSEYNIGLLKKLILVYKVARNNQKIKSGTDFIEHLVMITRIFKVSSSIPGCVIECGTYKGASACNLSLACALVNRKLEIFDSFQGLPKVKAGDKCPNCGAKVIEIKTVEAGNIFDQETLFTTAQEALFTAADGARRPINMSAYGIGVSRIMGTIVEASHDEHGIVWTPSVAPFQAHLILLADDTKVVATGLQLAQSISQNWEVLLDDRPMSVGQKLHDADLLGIPVQIIVGPKALPQIEWKLRRELSTSLVESAAIPDLLERFYAQTPIR